MSMRIAASLPTALAALVLSGCGGANHANAGQTNCATRAGAASATDTGSAQATGKVIEIEARDFAFHPTCVLDVPTGVVTLVIHNTGAQLHNIQVASQRIDRDIPPGATVRVTLHMGETPVVFVCKYHRGIGMAGALFPASAPPTGGT